jgi:23S rRNA G2445 N2-methylase RlmL
MQNSRRANVGQWLKLERNPLAVADAGGAPAGLLICNPPYGKRLGESTALERLYLQLGEVLKQRFGGWTACVLSGGPRLSAAIGLKATHKLDVKNGPLDCRALVYPSALRRARRAATRIRCCESGDF